MSTTNNTVTAVADTKKKPVNAEQYNSLNNQIWSEGGGGHDAHMEQAGIEAEKRQNDPNYGKAYTYDELVNLGAAHGIDASRFQVNPARGANSSDPNYQYTDRTVENGASGADEFWMSDGALDLSRIVKQNYANAKTPEEQAYWHSVEESIRAMHGYSGGADGSMYISNGEMGIGDLADHGSHGANGAPYTYPTGDAGAGTVGSTGTSSDLKGLLEAWQQAALGQSSSQVDYAVAKAVADLERALADAQPQFKEQAEAVAREERQALDNSALYAEMRGDKGGIGQEQYNSIQNTAAQNHLTVQQAQTKLATDTQRQIADLRAQGEFEKADAALQITQQYLQQLIGIEQWAEEFGLSVEQFNEQVRQWEAEYNMAMQQFQTGVNQWQAEFNAAQSQWQQQFDYGKQSDLANVGWALLESGIPLSEEQMSAMGIDPGQASQILMQQQLEAALKNNGSGTPVTDDVKMSLTTAKELAKNGIFSEQVLDLLRKNGYDDAALSKIYGYVPQTGGLAGGKIPTAEIQTANYDTLKGHIAAWPSRGITISNIAHMIEAALSAGNISETQAEELLDLMEQRVG